MAKRAISSSPASPQGGAGAPKATPEMVSAALTALEPYLWEDGSLGSVGRPDAIEAALRAALPLMPGVG
jgi:hypothetical protein